MKGVIFAAILFILVVTVAGKPIYDFKVSYVTQLTDFNFKDQVTKIRQNTNYVSIVQFYKYDGSSFFTQMVNLFSSFLKWISGSTNTTVCSGLVQLIVKNTRRFVRRKELKCSLPSRFTPQHQFRQL